MFEFCQIEFCKLFVFCKLIFGAFLKLAELGLLLPLYEVTSTLNYFHLILTQVSFGINFLSLVDFLNY